MARALPPVCHSFQYSVRCALFDLNHASYLLRGHLFAKNAPRIAKTTSQVYLLTIPPSMGYEPNPLSLYYCYDLEGTTKVLKKCIAEDMLRNWSLRVNAPGENLLVAISVQQPELGDYFLATLKAKRISLALVHNHELFFWLMPHKVNFPVDLLACFKAMVEKRDIHTTHKEWDERKMNSYRLEEVIRELWLREIMGNDRFYGEMLSGHGLECSVRRNNDLFKTSAPECDMIIVI
ncbi:hypothetical protein DITRI_Ditri02bG0057000 [Diplodiscus trichospermus]